MKAEEFDCDSINANFYGTNHNKKKSLGPMAEGYEFARKVNRGSATRINSLIRVAAG
jgi:hypothetical protein